MMSQTGSPPSSQPRRAALRRLPWRKKWTFALLSVGVGLAPLVVLELVLACIGAGELQEGYRDPYVGFSGQHPLFEKDGVGDDAVYRTAVNRQLFFGEQSFAANKPPNGFRAFCLGGSTVRGRPYETQTAFPAWLQLELNAIDSERTYEVVNCGGLSYASYRLTYLLQELLQYQPDLIVVATGHNEFLEDRTYREIKQAGPVQRRLRQVAYSLRTVTLLRRAIAPADKKKSDISPKPSATGSGSLETATDSQGRTVLKSEVDARLDQQSGYASYHRDEAWRQGVIKHFGQSLRAIVDICRRADVPLILVNLESNLRDCPPFKSEHVANLSKEDQRRWRLLFDQAEELEKQDAAKALVVYDQAAKIDDQYALLHFRRARCLDLLGDQPAAANAYLQAKQLDVCPLRAISEIRETLREVAGSTKTPLVDVAVDIGSLEKIPGNDRYLDHVHPTIGVHQRIAARLEQIMRSQRLLGQDLRHWTDRQRRVAYRQYIEQLGQGYFRNGRRRVGWLENWARRNKLLEETLPRDARAMIHLGQRRFAFGELEGAFEIFGTALQLAPDDSVQRLLDFGLQLFQEGRARDARQLLRWLAEEYPQYIEPPHLHQRWELAQLVLALELDDTPEITAIWKRSGEALAKMKIDESRWLATVPDALALAAKVGR